MAGEAGIGKSAVVRSFAAGCGRRAQVLSGCCDPLVTPRALGPLHDVGRQVGGPLDAALRAGAGQAELFAALVDELDRVVRQRRCVLIIEDVHWADEATLDQLERNGQVLLRYCRGDGTRIRAAAEDDLYNPNGTLRDVAGVMSAGRNVFGLMPHPEHAADPDLWRVGRPGTVEPDGLKIFRSISRWLSDAREERAVESQR